jgi:hypothetical protein
MSIEVRMQTVTITKLYLEMVVNKGFVHLSLEITSQ